MAGQSAAATAAASRRRTSSATSAATRRAGSRSSSRTRRSRSRLPPPLAVVVAAPHLPPALHALRRSRSRSGRLALTTLPLIGCGGGGDVPPPSSLWYRYAERGSRWSVDVSTSRRPM